MGSNSCFANKRYANGDRSEEEWLPAANAVEEEGDEDEIANWTDNVVDASHEKRAVVLDAQVFVENSRVVSNDVDTVKSLVTPISDQTRAISLPCHLSEKLNESSVHQSRPPGLDLEHDQPSRRRNSLLGLDSSLDFMELSLDIIFIASVEMQFAQNLQSLVGPINLDEISRTFWEEQDTTDDDETWYDLKCERESPGE